MNELSKSNNALTITEQFPEGKYNLLVPIKTVAEIAEIHKPVMNVVYISTELADKEIYLQNKPDDWALTKKALTKLMTAAGIKVLKSEPMLPTKCEKCAAVNRGIGKPVNCGACPNKDVKHQVVISMPQLTGENVQVVGTKEILFDDVTATMTEAQKKEFTKFRSEMCETKALNRALRIAMQIKPTYKLPELRKPFVVAYLVPNLDNPAVKEAAINNLFSAAKELYGVTETAATAKRTIYANDDEEIEYADCLELEMKQQQEMPEDVSEEKIYQEAQNTVMETSTAQNTTQGREFFDDPTVCHKCGKKLSEKVTDYSIKRYGLPYCYDCQKEIQNSRG